MAYLYFASCCVLESDKDEDFLLVAETADNSCLFTLKRYAGDKQLDSAQVPITKPAGQTEPLTSKISLYHRYGSSTVTVVCETHYETVFYSVPPLDLAKIQVNLRLPGTKSVRSAQVSAHYVAACVLAKEEAIAVVASPCMEVPQILNLGGIPLRAPMAIWEESNGNPHYCFVESVHQQTYLRHNVVFDKNPPVAIRLPQLDHTRVVGIEVWKDRLVIIANDMLQRWQVATLHVLVMALPSHEATHARVYRHVTMADFASPVAFSVAQCGALVLWPR